MVDICLIKRRHNERAGTRMNARGIDDNGNVANYVETEQLVLVNNFLYSFVILRGSVPLFWQQNSNGKTKLHEDVEITRSLEMTVEPFTKHFKSMIADYKHVHCVDLLKDLREREDKLTQGYYKLFFDS